MISILKALSGRNPFNPVGGGPYGFQFKKPLGVCQDIPSNQDVVTSDDSIKDEPEKKVVIVISKKKDEQPDIDLPVPDADGDFHGDDSPLT